MKRIRVLVADDHAVVRLGICEALKQEPDIEIVGEATQGRQALELAQSLKPGVFILDMQMPEMDGVDVARQLQKHDPGVRILVLSAYADDDYVFGTLSLGASGYLLKDDALENVVGAVRTVAEGKTWLSPQIASKVVERATGQKAPDEAPPPHGPNLPTQRELEVLRLVAAGCSNDDIAESLCITERTVRFHVTNLCEKLHASSRLDMVIKALRQGLIEL